MIEGVIDKRVTPLLIECNEGITDTFDQGIAVGNPKGGTMNSEFYSDNDAVQELRLNTVNNSAEYASQAVVNQTSIAGTNRVHGLFEYRLYNEALDARPWFSKTRPLDRGNYYYGQFDGPVYIRGPGAVYGRLLSGGELGGDWGDERARLG